MDMLAKIPKKAGKRLNKLREMRASGSQLDFWSYLVSCLPFVTFACSVLLAVLLRSAQYAVVVAGYIGGKRLNDVLKDLFKQPRPEGAKKTHGMPSFHAQASFCFAAMFHGLGLVAPPLMLYATAALVSLSRLQLQRHTPERVLVGAVVGQGSGWALAAAVAWGSARAAAA